MAKLEQGINDLYTWCINNGDWGKRLISEWVGLYEDNQPVSMDDISYGSAKKVKWRCDQGHTWSAVVSSRTGTKTRCPYCSQERNSELTAKCKLKIGINDLYTWCRNNGEFGQQLIREWTGLDEHDNTIKMDEVAKASKKRVKWKCSKGHEWIGNLWK